MARDTTAAVVGVAAVAYAVIKMTEAVTVYTDIGQLLFGFAVLVLGAIIITASR